jgi:hypothetical protein
MEKMNKLTLVESPQACKTYTYQYGKIVSDHGHLTSGLAKCISYKTLEDIVKYCNGQYALIHGIPKQDLNCRTGSFQLTTSKNEDYASKLLSRTRKNFVYDKEAIVLLDIDQPSDAGYNFTDIHTLIRDLCDIYQVLEGKELLAIPSSSNGLLNSETGNPIKSNSDAKWHIYFRIKSELIPAFKQYLQDFAWVKGFGYAHISRSGAVLQRCIVDLTVFSPERIDYIGSIKDETGKIIENKPQHVFQAGDVITEVPDNPYIIEAENLFNQKRICPDTKEKVYSKRKTWLESKVSKGSQNLTADQIDKSAKKFAEREHHYDCLPDDIHLQIGKQSLTPSQVSEKLRKLKGKYCADPFTGEDCKCKIVAAPYADLGFLLYSYKIQGYYYFGNAPTPISELQMKTGKQNLEVYLEKMADSPKLNILSHWRQAVNIDNQWYSFWESYNGITTIANILLAKSNIENADNRAERNATKIADAANRYFSSADKCSGKVALLVGNPGDGKSYAANLAIKRSKGASIFVTNTKKNMHDFSEHALNDFFNIYGNTDILWGLLQKQFGYEEADKVQFDNDVSKLYELKNPNLLGGLANWFEYNSVCTAKDKLEEQARQKVIHDYHEVLFEQKANDSRHQILTLAKAKNGLNQFKKKIELLKQKYGRVTVYLDEMDAMKVNPQSGFVSVYNRVAISTFDCDSDQKQLMDYLFGEKELFVVLMSAEKGIAKALCAREIEPVVIDNFCTLIDYDLSIAYVKSTSKQTLEVDNSEFFNVVSKIVSTYSDYLVVTNGLTDKQKDMLSAEGLKLTTHEALKGNNDKSSTDIISIVTYPSPIEIQQYLLALGIDDTNRKESDELGAIRTIVSNRFNQTIGRNTGYRGGNSSVHIAILPIGLADLLDSYIVTTQHCIFDDISKEPDLELLAALCKEKVDEYKVEREIEIIENSTKLWFKELFVYPTYEQHIKQFPKSKLKKSELSKQFFSSYAKERNMRVNGIPTKIFVL